MKNQLQNKICYNLSVTDVNQKKHILNLEKLPYQSVCTMLSDLFLGWEDAFLQQNKRKLSIFDMHNSGTLNYESFYLRKKAENWLPFTDFSEIENATVFEKVGTLALRWEVELSGKITDFRVVLTKF